MQRVSFNRSRFRQPASPPPCNSTNARPTATDDQALAHRGALPCASYPVDIGHGQSSHLRRSASAPWQRPCKFSRVEWPPLAYRTSFLFWPDLGSIALRPTPFQASCLLSPISRSQRSAMNGLIIGRGARFRPVLREDRGSGLCRLNGAAAATTAMTHWPVRDLHFTAFCCQEPCSYVSPLTVDFVGALCDCGPWPSWVLCSWPLINHLSGVHRCVGGKPPRVCLKLSRYAKQRYGTLSCTFEKEN
jgi:hypothetical protein